MKNGLSFLFSLLFFTSFGQVEYPVHLDSKVQEGVPQGEVLGPFMHESTVFPGTVREYWIYVPKQYKKENPAALMVSFDGFNMAVNQWKLPIVYNNLIHKKEVPITIGIFIDVGIQESTIDGTYDRPIRSVEYDSRSTETAVMVIDEILPKVKALFNISNDANDHLIAGNSSGGNAAFSVAWERPDVFSRVFSGIGSFTSLRDGHEFLTLIRKTEHKRLRIYLQDGNNDLNNFSGNWFLANQYMLSSLEWAGYEVNHTWGEDTHSYRHASAIMPDILRWLWKDHPKPVGVNHSIGYEPNIIKEGETWQLLTNKVKGNLPITSNESGDLFFLDASGTSLNKINAAGSIVKLASYDDTLKGLAFTADKTICSCKTEKNQIVKIYPGNEEVIVNDVKCDNLLPTQKGIYFLNKVTNTLGFYQFENKSISTINTIEQPSGISISAEQNFLNITNEKSVHGYSVSMEKNGTPKIPLAFFHYTIPYSKIESGAMGMVVDAKNKTYTATAMGVQVADELGRTAIIMPLPDSGTPYQLSFGGISGNALYTITSTGIYSRIMLQKGAKAWSEPIAIDKPMHVKSLKK